LSYTIALIDPETFEDVTSREPASLDHDEYTAVGLRALKPFTTSLACVVNGDYRKIVHMQQPVGCRETEREWKRFCVAVRAVVLGEETLSERADRYRRLLLCHGIDPDER
jgi:hypothetical protein